MMNLSFGDGTALLTCSSCARRWVVSTREPFVAQLRELLVGHVCDADGVTSLADWKRATHPSPTRQ